MSAEDLRFILMVCSATVAVSTAMVTGALQMYLLGFSRTDEDGDPVMTAATPKELHAYFYARAGFGLVCLLTAGLTFLLYTRAAFLMRALQALFKT